MRTGPFGVVWFAAVLAALLLPGCESAPQPAPSQSTAAAEPDDDALTSAELYARQLAEAMARQGQSQAPSIPLDVQWLEPGSPVPQAGVPRHANRTPAAPEVEPELAIELPQPVAIPDTEPIVPATRAELVEKLRQRIADSGDAPLVKALDSAVLALLLPDGQPDRSHFDGLNFEQRDQVDRYHHVMRLLLEDLKQNDTYFDRVAFDKRMDHLFGHQPIKIRHTALCRRVMGFGVYEPFESKTFLVGRDNKMIVYVELDQFLPRETADGQHEVKLQQELALFNESDGLVVWRNDPVSIVDTSRNRRRDFFVVQLVTMPARLTVGKYRLKVRVTDMHGGAVDETTIPVELVADQSLVQSR